MRRRLGSRSMWCSVLTATLLPLAAPAHHSGAMFDSDKKAKVVGTVRTLEWANPHVWLWVWVATENHDPVLYAFEGTSIGEMNRRGGWTKRTVQEGDKITVDYEPFREDKKGGRLLQVTLQNGEVHGSPQ